MATFDSIFPTFLAKCGELHTLLLSVAFALFIVGIIVTVFRKFTHRAALDLLLRLLLLTSLLVFLPAWGNTLQNLLQTSILSGLGVDPANVYQQFNQLLIIKRDPATTSSWWNVMSQLHNFTTDLIISAVLWLVGQFASLMMFWAYIFQTIILNLRALALAHRFHGNPGVEAHRQPLPHESCRRFVVAAGLGARCARDTGHPRFHDRPKF
jgi:hypothetical protein